MGFTFKKKVNTGRYSSFQGNFTTIKIKKKNCGFITRSSYNYPYGLWLMVEKTSEIDDGTPNCSWMNICLKEDFKTEDEARIWVNEHFDELNNKYKIHIQEE